MGIVERIQADPRAETVSNECEDGWWVMLTSGYCWPEGQTHAVHERSLRDLWRVFKTVKKCDCNDCRILKSSRAELKDTKP